MLGLGLGSALGLLLGLIILWTLSQYYCAQSIDRQRAIIPVPARSPSASKTLVKYELQQQHFEATGYDYASGLRRPLPLLLYSRSCDFKSSRIVHCIVLCMLKLISFFEAYFYLHNGMLH